MPYRRNDQPFFIDFHDITQSSAQQNTPFCSIKHGLSACKHGLLHNERPQNAVVQTVSSRTNDINI